MSPDKGKAAIPKLPTSPSTAAARPLPGKAAPGKPAPAKAVAVPVRPLKPPPLFRPTDWIAFTLTTLVVLCGYLYSIAPDLTLEDSGELAVASMYAGVPHPPGYPVWSVYTWLFTKLLPFSNIAWRVAVSSAVAGALSCGLIAMMVSRGSSMFIEGIGTFKDLERKWENGICLVAGWVAGLLMGFNGFMWSQAVIVEVYTLVVLSMTGMMLSLTRWLYAPHQRRYLYLAWFLLGICINNHQSLLLGLIAVEITVAVADPKTGRDMFLWNLIGYAALQFLTAIGWISLLKDALPLQFFLFTIFLFSAVAFIYLAIKTKGVGNRLHIGVFCGLWGLLGLAFYLYLPVASMSNPPLNWAYPRTATGFLHALTRGQYERIHPSESFGKYFGSQLFQLIEGAAQEFNPVYLLIALVPLFFWSRMKIRERAWLASVGGFYLALGPWLLELINPATDRQSVSLNKVFFTASHVSLAMSVGYGLALLTAGLITTQRENPRRGFGFLGAGVAAGAIFGLLFFLRADALSSNQLVLGVVCLALVIVAFLAAAGLIGWLWWSDQMGVWDLALLAGVGLGLAGWDLRNTYQLTDLTLSHFTAIFGLTLAAAITVILLLSRKRLLTGALLLVMATMPGWAVLSHWWDNEQADHLFGFWFGHDMFTPPFLPVGAPKNGRDFSYSRKLREEALKGPDAKYVYPEMDRDAVLFGGTDPGRFCPTYMIFCESFIKPKHRRNPEFDRRDVVLITQNALADGTYLQYIRAHYNRSTQIDPYFFSEFVRSDLEREAGYKTNLLARTLLPLDRLTTWVGSDIERQRRAGSSYFHPDDFTDFAGFARKLTSDGAPPALSKYLFDQSSEDTRKLLAAGDSPAARRALTKDLNKVIEGGSIFLPARFTGVPLSNDVQRFIEENPQGHSRIRLNRRLLEGAYPEIARSPGGVYPDREILTPSEEDSKRCFQEYMNDATRRFEHDRQFPNEPPQVRPGEDLRVDGGRVQVSGQVAVMAINALLTKVIFDKNPGHEFYVEESFPLDWMYPHLTPFSIIMKIERQPVAELTQDMVDRDHQFWSLYMDRLISNWITYDTPISNICAWAEQVYVRKNLSVFKGDPRFLRDEDGQKAFSKLRSSIGGVYDWRTKNYKSPADHDRMYKEAEFAFKQAYALCPFSPEALYRYVNLLLMKGRISDALMLAETSKKLDRDNPQIDNLIGQLRKMGGDPRAGAAGAPAPALAQLEAEFQRNPGNPGAAMQLMQGYASLGQTDKVLQVADRIVALPDPNRDALFFAIQAYSQLKQYPRLEQALTRWTALEPTPEAWMDLAGIQAVLGKPEPAIASLQQSLKLNGDRLKTNAAATNLALTVLTDARFAAVRERPDFKALVGQYLK